MLLRHRSMSPKDIADCVAIIATHPVIGPRYGDRIDDLRRAWSHLLGSEAMITALVEDVEESPARIFFVGVAVCVHDEFLQELKSSPPVWVGPELARRVLDGRSPLLSDRQLREANSSDGLNNLGWEGCIR